MITFSILGVIYGIPAGLLIGRALVLVGAEWPDIKVRCSTSGEPPPEIMTLGIFLMRIAGAGAWPICIFPWTGYLLRERRERKAKSLPAARIVE